MKHTTAKHDDSAKTKKSRSRQRGFGVHYAFPILVAILMWYLLSQHIFTQFKKNSTPDKPDLIPHESQQSLSVDYLNDSTAKIIFQKIFTADEEIFKEKIIEIESLIESNQLKAAMQELKLLGKLLTNSPRFVYASALLIDKISEFEKSNTKLIKSIEIYKKLFTLDDVDLSLMYLAGRRLMNRLLFMGKIGDATKYGELLTRSIPNNINILNELGVCYLMGGRPKLAKEQFQQVLRLSGGQNAVALCHYGFILKTTEYKLEESIGFMEKCLSSDKTVMDGRFFYHLGDALQRLNQTKKAFEFYQIGVENGVFMSIFQRSLYNEPNLRAKPWWNLEETTYHNYLSLLEENWLLIKNEAFAQFNEKTESFMPEDENLRDTGEWQQFNLYISGKKVEKNCQKTPFTCSLLEQITPATSCTRGQIKFSIMSPKVHVWPHCGPTNCRLRAHLGLKVSNEARIRVADEERNWQAGKILVFDDSFEHEVWNDGSEYRMVLIVDLWHPDLMQSQRDQLSPI